MTKDTVDLECIWLTSAVAVTCAINQARIVLFWLVKLLLIVLINWI
jgi:hypothetical protein